VLVESAHTSGLKTKTVCLWKRMQKVNTTGPEKESSQNRTGGVSEGKGTPQKVVWPLNLVDRNWSRVKRTRDQFSVYGK
jgi:hypothetical protein